MKTLTEKIIECNNYINTININKKDEKLLLIKKYEKYKNAKAFKGKIIDGIKDFEKIIDEILT